MKRLADELLDLSDRDDFVCHVFINLCGDVLEIFNYNVSFLKNLFFI